jgi:hypothetical protein
VLTIPAGAGGLWLVGYRIHWPSSVAGEIASWIHVGSGYTSTRLGEQRWYVGSSALDTASQSATVPVLLAAGDTVQTRVRQDNSGNVARNIGGTNSATWCEMWATYLQPA